MEAYITCPCDHSNKRLSLLPIIKEAVLANGFEAFIFKIGGDDPKEILRRDYEQMKKCDLIIAEVSERSHGVGIEIGISYCLGLKRILLLAEGEHITKLAQGMPDTHLIYYKDKKDLKEKLNNKLKTIK